MCLFKKAVLVIHGFGGATWENEFLVNDLKMNSEYKVFDFTLPGHTLEIIKGVQYQEWIRTSEEMLQTILKKYRSVYLVGHSMGGVIASYLASKYKGVKKLVLLAPAFDYVSIDQMKQDAKTFFENKLKLNKDGALYDEAFMKMIRVPLPTIIEFTKLVKVHREDIVHVKCKTLILHGTMDELTPMSSSEYAYSSIGAKEKHFTKIEGVRHRILVSNKKKEVSTYIRSFLIGGLEWELKKKSQI